MASIGEYAKKAGQSPKAFAEANIHADGALGKLARLYYVKMGLNGGGTMNEAGDASMSRNKLYQVG